MNFRPNPWFYNFMPECYCQLLQELNSFYLTSSCLVCLSVKHTPALPTAPGDDCREKRPTVMDTVTSTSSSSSSWSSVASCVLGMIWNFSVFTGSITLTDFCAIGSLGHYNFSLCGTIWISPVFRIFSLLKKCIFLVQSYKQYCQFAQQLFPKFKCSYKRHWNSKWQEIL